MPYHLHTKSLRDVVCSYAEFTILLQYYKEKFGEGRTQQMVPQMTVRTDAQLCIRLVLL